MVAGDGMPGDGQAVQEAPGPVELTGIVETVEGEIADVHHQVGPGAVDMTEHGVPVGPAFRGTR
jgi:hypothetical protein